MNNVDRMTIVEQIVKIREEICEYTCKYRDIAKMNKDPYMEREILRKYCKECPVGKLHYERL